MGGAQGNMGISNSTPFDIQVKLHSDRVMVTKDSKKTSYSVGLSGGYAGVKGGADFGYSGEVSAEYAHSLVDPNFRGYTTVNANTRKDWEGLDTTKTWYITVIIQLGDDKVKVQCESEQLHSPNVILGFTESGKFEFVDLDPNRSWRVKAGRGTQNYYGRVCNGCGNIIACPTSCSDYKEFGGHHL
ncbi:UNKNOWN [Stylonychia lemnae]|uniref:Uncharacterized protein n=1 Tax=Stylonychia lemnae TaxID=5949 RepID=A0A077ZXS0_STYLE|nr:UNKNOWN [Stylonychia lemnae]|eukprot:CDW74372.1 UNKNOWN [Stylonychia lemnae]